MKLKTLVVALSMGLSTQAFAGSTTTYQSNSETQDQVYAGLVWSLQDLSMTPELNVGYRTLKVKSNDQVDGVDVSFKVTLKNGPVFDSTRLSYVGGERNLLGNIGIGYSYTNATLLGTFAAQGPYVRIGADYELNNEQFKPYLEVLTADSPDKVNKKVIVTQELN